MRFPAPPKRTDSPETHESDYTIMERDMVMNRKLTKALCLMLSVIMLFGVIPMQAVAEAIDVASSKVEYPTGDSDGLILEFSSAGALEVFRAV